MYKEILLLVGWLTATALPGGAQVSVEDAPVLAAKALQVVALLTEQPIESDERVWVGGFFDSGELRGSIQDLVVALQPHFPGAQGTEGYTELFLCPPGEEVRMPGNGCPILDDGRIVRFLVRDPDEPWAVKLIVTVVTTGCDGECTWREAWSVQFRRVRGSVKWRIGSVTFEGIT